ncbi:RagB/SusD family nutrient uptake outer membrane protein [Proteiniphilum sp.]|uniref:RagB/SusD family nutrient uptake outer membrane protein n=1 Tax=Proteiniphilum sp. TaxID=1926877 RepID=UPI002B20CD70|nr:RagB/SusD family nutrient uptake outer membrane protein [Proteiniphilum sp.]MEA4916899.1 RagB/SusD family nutrient uptake outer membrane protein [Proteiniphilum sp.]
MKKIIYLFSIILLLSTCNDDFMDRQPKTEIGVERFFNTEEDLKMYIYGLYNFSGHGMYAADGGTDNQATTSGSVEIKNIMTANNPSSTTITSGWSWGRLRDINLFLANVERAQVSPDVKAHYEGIARFFRARFYMDKVKRYSDVPWYDKVIETNDQEALFKGCDSRDFVIGKIFEDYQFAAENVKTGQPSGAIDKWGVLAFFSRDALYEGTYRKYHPELNLASSANIYLQMARDAAKRVMDNGQFSIYSTGNPDKDYLSLFRSGDLSSNPEIILATFYDPKEVKAGTSEWNFGNYEPSPAKDLVQNYLMNDATFYSAQQGYQTRQFVEEFKNRDPRLSQTYAYPGWELVQTATYVSGAGIYVQQFNKNFTGYHLIKGFANNREADVYNDLDYPVLRYAEVLLNYAEAKAELNEFTQSDVEISLNLLRRRVAMPDFNMNPTVDPLSAAKFGNISALLHEIRRERRVELAFEGFRFDDLMRWHAGKVLEKVPEGLYFPSLGKFDLNGDGVEDAYLIPSSQSIPADADKEVNSKGVKLVYYRTGGIDDSNATVYLANSTSGNIVAAKDMGIFVEPQFYYRPIPIQQITLNPALGPQLFGWK